MDLLRVMELEGSGEGNTKRKITVVDCGELDEDGEWPRLGLAWPALSTNGCWGGLALPEARLTSAPDRT